MSEDEMRSRLPGWARNLPIEGRPVAVTGDHDQAYAFGQVLSTDKPGPFTTIQFSRLLRLRSLIEVRA